METGPWFEISAERQEGEGGGSDLRLVLLHLTHYIMTALETYYFLCYWFNEQIVHKKHAGPGCSKLTISLVNLSLKFQTLIPEKCQNFLLKKI